LKSESGDVPLTYEHGGARLALKKAFLEKHFGDVPLGGASGWDQGEFPNLYRKQNLVALGNPRRKKEERKEIRKPTGGGGDTTSM